jgi:thiamine-phosphate pyrophosphorylase
MSVVLPPLYPITDTYLSGLSHAEQVRRMIAGGAKLIQLREKRASPEEFYREAEKALQIAHNEGVKIIINDRVDIALALKADGTHLGQDDLPPGEARKLLGNKAIIGFSTHNMQQAVAAIKFPVDYIAIGPIFATNSKEDPGPTVGIEQLALIRQALQDFPLVAIGGITELNFRALLAMGVDSVAVINSILTDQNKISERVKLFTANN